MSKELEVAIKAAKEAGEILKENFNNTNPVTFKDEGGSLTKIDTLSETKIVSILKENFPNHSINAEESGLKQKNSKFLWLVDPIDGTSNFAAQIPLFVVSIALSQSNIFQLGVIYEPLFNNLYVSEKNEGSKLNGNKSSVNDVNTLAKSIVSYGRAPSSKDEFLKIFTKLEKKTRTQRVLGSMMLELCYVAVGKIEATILLKPYPWDLAAGALLIEEAGGKVTDFEGNSWSPGSERILATNGRIHDELVDILKE